MSTWFETLRGKTKFFRPHSLSQFNKFEHVLYPIPEDVEKIRELQTRGLMNTLRKDEEGYNINIGRPPEITVRGMKKALPPIVITDKDDKPFTDNVGDGSDVTTVVEVYDFTPKGMPLGSKKKVAWRWSSSRIDNLVPFEKKDLTATEQKAVSHLATTPVPTWAN